MPALPASPAPAPSANMTLPTGGGGFNERVAIGPDDGPIDERVAIEPYPDCFDDRVPVEGLVPNAPVPDALAAPADAAAVLDTPGFGLWTPLALPPDPPTLVAPAPPASAVPARPAKRPGWTQPERMAVIMEKDPDKAKALGMERVQDRYVTDALNPNSPTALKEQMQTSGSAGTHTDNVKNFNERLVAQPERMRDRFKYQGMKGRWWNGTKSPIEMDLGVTNGLTQAELLAIKTFTAGDYHYINPAVADDAKFMNTQMGRTDRTLFEEGQLHAHVMMQGLAKLPQKTGKTYRGARMTRKDFDEHYRLETVFRNPNFSSSSTNRARAQVFADKNDDHNKTVSVLCISTINNAIDISRISVYPNEEEWLLLPGSEFKVVSRVQQATGNDGNPQATEWWEVHLIQTGPPRLTAAGGHRTAPARKKRFAGQWDATASPSGGP